jgi:polyisoprenoid-binding protein YceI
MRTMLMGFCLIGWTMWSTAMAGSELPKRFHLDPAASHVWFEADARLHSFRGQTRRVSGSFLLTQTSPPHIAEAQVRIDAASLDTGNAERDADMRRDFLEVAKFPTIEFAVTELPIAQPAADGNTWDVVVKGKLTIHGVTRDVQVPTTVGLAPDGLIARGRVYLDIRDFDIRVPRLLFIPMKSEVLVGFEVMAHPQP